MQKISLPLAARLTSPNPVTLVCTAKADGTPNLATVSWWTYLSFQPGMIGFAMAKTAFTGETVRANGQLILTIPGEAIADAVLGCGACSGRDTDKVKKLGLALQSLPETDISVPLHTRAAFVCRLKEYVEVGDHYLYLCEVDAVYGDASEKALFAWNGYAEIRPAE